MNGYAIRYGASPRTGIYRNGELVLDGPGVSQQVRRSQIGAVLFGGHRHCPARGHQPCVRWNRFPYRGRKLIMPLTQWGELLGPHGTGGSHMVNVAEVELPEHAAASDGQLSPGDIATLEIVERLHDIAEAVSSEGDIACSLKTNHQREKERKLLRRALGYIFPEDSFPGLADWLHGLMDPIMEDPNHRLHGHHKRLTRTGHLRGALYAVNLARQTLDPVLVEHLQWIGYEVASHSLNRLIGWAAEHSDTEGFLLKHSSRVADMLEYVAANESGVRQLYIMERSPEIDPDQMVFEFRQAASSWSDWISTRRIPLERMAMPDAVAA